MFQDSSMVEVNKVKYMEEEQAQVAMIEKYLQGHLEPEERSAFERQLNSDPLLAKKTSSYRDSFTNSFSSQHNKIRRGLSAVGRTGSHLSQNIYSLHKKKIVVKIIGIITLLTICIISVYFLLDKSTDNAALFTQYYNESIVNHPLLKDQNQEETYGISHYQNRDFQRAIPALEKEIIASPGDARLYLYLGLSYLESDNDEKALLNFKKAESVAESKIRNSAIWYLALTEVKLNHTKEAKNNLLELINISDSNPYVFKAKYLLQEL